MFKLRTLLLVAVMLGVAIPATAQERGKKGGPHGDPAAHIDQLIDELDLSTDQASQVRPILEESMNQRRALFEGARTGQGRPDRSQMQALRPEMEAIREQTDAQLAEVLTADQMAQLREIRASRQAEHRAHRKSHRGGRTDT
jgi:Spy/CpxP family protein refolding chaperone